MKGTPPRRSKKTRIPTRNSEAKALVLKTPERSRLARDRSLHVLAAMRRDPSLSLNRAAKLEGVKPETVKKNFPAALRKSGGKYSAMKRDRYAQTLYVPDAHGKAVAVYTRSSKERTALGRYLSDLGRYLRGDRHALAAWHGKRIAGIELLTAGRTIIGIEPALSGFSLYRALNGGAA